MESVIKAERRSNIDTDESCDVEIQWVSQQNKIFSSRKSGASKELMMLLSWSFSPIIGRTKKNQKNQTPYHNDLNIIFE